MRHPFLLAAILSAGLIGGGCAKHHHTHARHKLTSPDACATCVGDQVATADGKCPTCGRAVDATVEPTQLEKTSTMQ